MTASYGVYLGDVPLQDGPIRVLPLHAFRHELSPGRAMAPIDDQFSPRPHGRMAGMLRRALPEAGGPRRPRCRRGARALDRRSGRPDCRGWSAGGGRRAGGAPRAVDVRRPQVRPRLQALRVRQPRGAQGRRRQAAAIGTFDNLNPFILKGVPAGGHRRGLRHADGRLRRRAFSQYGLVAETIEVPADRSWVAFTLRPEARFHDGSPMTVEDVIWTSRRSRRKGHPFYRATTRRSSRPRRSARARSSSRSSGGENRELPLIVGQLPVLSKRVLEQARVREDHAGGAARQRPLPRGGGGARALHHLPARQGLLGGASCP